MEKEGVVPDVIDVSPAEICSISYDSGVICDMGKVLTPTQVKTRPTVTWNADGSSFYTLVLTDPDAPSRASPTFREWLHFIVYNIPGNNVDGGEILFDYIGSGPPKGTGLHRYVWLVYKQPGKITCDEGFHSRTPEGRGKFSVRNFAKKYNLGQPAAGNFYQAEYDDYVPHLFD